MVHEVNNTSNFIRCSLVIAIFIHTVFKCVDVDAQILWVACVGMYVVDVWVMLVAHCIDITNPTCKAIAETQCVNL